MNASFNSFINVADIPGPDGRTHRQVNSEMTHQIPMGALVEVVGDDPSDGIRLWVVYRGRDCDETPLYWLAPDRDDTELNGRLLGSKWVGGYPEESLKVIRLS